MGESFFKKKLTVVYIQNGLTFGYTAQVLNIFNSHSFSNVGLIHCFLTHTHTRGNGIKFFLKKLSVMYNFS